MVSSCHRISVLCYSKRPQQSASIHSAPLWRLWWAFITTLICNNEICLYKTINQLHSHHYLRMKHGLGNLNVIALHNKRASNRLRVHSVAHLICKHPLLCAETVERASYLRNETATGHEQATARVTQCSGLERQSTGVVILEHPETAASSRRRRRDNGRSAGTGHSGRSSWRARSATWEPARVSWTCCSSSDPRWAVAACCRRSSARGTPANKQHPLVSAQFFRAIHSTFILNVLAAVKRFICRRLECTLAY